MQKTRKNSVVGAMDFTENKHPLKELVAEQKKGITKGVYSACSANEYVIEAFLERALEKNEYAIIEATANQVNQYGGYTGMKPVDFRDFVLKIAGKVNFPERKLILGGDHLGPLTWKNEKAEIAMREAAELIRLYVDAGFTKIHIDTSMRLGDDALDKKLSTEVIAERGAFLAQVAEEAYEKLKEREPDAVQPVYIVGSEVPIPGGSQEEEEGLQITKTGDFRETVELFRKAYYKLGLEKAWDNVIGVVVQPGVEFGDETIHEYNRGAAAELTNALKEYPNLIFEGHSTDYQTGFALREMVEDGIAILKVGPALTFSLREGLFALNIIEKELLKGSENEGDGKNCKASRFVEVLEEQMLKEPSNWIKHYHGSESKLRLARKYSFSDRCRYYLPVKEVQDEINLMISNLKKINIPLTLISQYMPRQYMKIREGQLKNDPVSLLKDCVKVYIDDSMAGISCL